MCFELSKKKITWLVLKHWKFWKNLINTKNKFKNLSKRIHEHFVFNNRF